GVLLSRASGVIRTIVVNASFGAGLAMDSFNAAFRFPNGLRDLFADGALSSAFIKVLVDAKEKGIEEERKLISIVIGFFLCVTLFIAILCAVYSYEFMHFISDEKFKHSGGIFLASDLFKILAFYLPITMLNAVAMASLGVVGKTFRATNASLFLSVGMILGCFIFAPFFQFLHMNSIFGLAFGAMLGALFQLIYQFIPIIKLNLISAPNFNIKSWINYKPLKEVLTLMAPRALGQGALTIALLINTMFALQVGQGVLTYIVTAVMIIQVPIGLFGVATGFASLPVLTKAINDKEYLKFSKLLVESLETALWLALLTTAAFALFITPFYHLLFQHGKITFYDTIHNSIAVCAYSIGIVFSSGSKVLLNGFYTLNHTRQIVYNALVYLVLSALLSSLLAPKLGILGLGLSYGTSTAVDFFMNLYFLRRYYKKMQYGSSPYSAGGKYFSLKIVCFAVLSYALGLLGVKFIFTYWNQLHYLNYIKSFFILCGGGSIYTILCIAIIYFFGSNNLKQIVRSGLRKLSKNG
ncbi:MAG: murein biosynthesis integral membrane protein MurJ, partial [Bdellovibrionota bacterium]